MELKENEGNQNGPERGIDEFEALYAADREEDYAKRDRLVNRLMKAEKPKDVAAVIELLIDYENPHYGESIDRFTFTALKRSAVEGQRAYEKGSVKLSDKDAETFAKVIENEFNEIAVKTKVPQVIKVEKDGNILINGEAKQTLDLSVTYGLRSEGIISNDGLIASNGDLIEGDVRASGYALKVKKLPGVEKPRTTTERVYNVNPQTLAKEAPLQIIERTENASRPKEVVNFGTQKERFAMAKAHEALHQQLIVAEELQTQTISFDKSRAALEKMVEQFYQYQIYFTNKQIKWFFEAADISKITPENPLNKELGDKTDKAARLYYLIGKCETREKLEEHLNQTQNLEKILDYNPNSVKGADTTTIDRVLGVAKTLQTKKDLKIPEFKKDLNELQKLEPFEKFKLAVKFLIGPNVIISKRPDGQIEYTLDKWLAAGDRDPYPITKTHQRGGDTMSEFEYQQKLALYGAGSVNRKDDTTLGIKGEFGERGYLTEFGNPYAKTSRDALFALMGRMNAIVGNDRAVTEAGRFFWTRGMRDELALELYTDIKNFPTGEDLFKLVNDSSNEDRIFAFKDLQKLLTLEGEPVASDLSKTIQTRWWRFKEIIRDRSAGTPLTYDKLDYTMLSELRLCRTKLDAEDTPKEIKGEMRSLEEQWLGYKSTITGRPNEEAKDLGDMDWEMVKVPEDVAAAVELSGEGITDNADNYYWIMGYLSAEDGSPTSKDKRLYQYWMKPIDDPRKLQRPEYYTDKIKFWEITRHDAVAINGEWRKLYENSLASYPKIDPEKRIKFANFMARQKASDDIKQGKKDWYMGEMSTVGYTTWQTTTTEYRSYKQNKNIEIDLLQYIEGTVDNPGFVVKYGFLDKEQIGNPPAYYIRLPS